LLGRLAAGVSHEIRNPLGVITLYVSLLEEELRQPSPESAAEIAQALIEIKTNLARLDDLVQDYRSLVRVSNIQREPVALHALVTQFAREMTAALTACGITLHLDGIVSLGTVALHQNTFRRALLNLVHNAIEAMPKGGTLTLRGRRDATMVQLDVSDTGSGIPPEQCARIFEPLYTTKPGGTGLGLFIVHEIVVAHGGQVAVQSAVGHGGPPLRSRFPWQGPRRPRRPSPFLSKTATARLAASANWGTPGGSARTACGRRVLRFLSASTNR
jgi:signal transduction histidine kinase